MSGVAEGEEMMKLRMGRVELLTGLQRVQGVVEKRNTMPILSNILIEAKQEGVEIVATDLEIGMRGHYKAAVDASEALPDAVKTVLKMTGSNQLRRTRPKNRARFPASRLGNAPPKHRGGSSAPVGGPPRYPHHCRLQPSRQMFTGSA